MIKCYIKSITKNSVLLIVFLINPHLGVSFIRARSKNAAVYSKKILIYTDNLILSALNITLY